jgi:hypothetical protein
MKKIVTILLLLLSVSAFSQENSPWRSYFSYNNVVDITQSGSRVYAAAEQAIFSKNLLTNELKTITSVDGLKAETITAIYHSTAYNRTLIGNSNGLLLIVNADNTVVSRVDIIEETTVQSNKKRINHIYEYDGKAYISTDFGIAVFDIAAMEFGDTFYLGPNGAEVTVRQATVHNGYIYAACGDNAGIRRGLISNPFLNDYSQWGMYNSGSWNFIVTHNNMLVGADHNNLYKFNGPNDVSWFYSFNFSTPVLDLRSVNGSLLATVVNNIRLYNEQLQLQASVNVIPGETTPTDFSCATIINEQLFIGTTGKGVFATPVDLSRFENITPDGPERSNIFSLEKSPNFLWAVYGDYDSYYNPYPLEQYGISKLTPAGWETIKNEDLFNAASISDITVDPRNENRAYAASFHSGLIKIEDDVAVDIYDHTDNIQHGPESLILPPGPGSDPNYRSVRINSLTFDKFNNLWMTNSMVNNAIKVLKPDGQWMEYSVEGLTNDPHNDNYGKMVIDKNNTKWIPTLNSGLIAFNETINKVLVITDDNNLPTTYVRCVAIDNRNHLWIGTQKGLRVLRGVDRFLTESELTTNQIIIMEDGLAQELLYEQFITVIKVDGANNKWIGTSSAGAFLVSPDGQQTLFHFTKQNSPLPGNNINDIEIDPVTGEVFFATDKGMVSYKGTSTKASDDLSKVYVFPNPVRPGFEGDVNISGLIDKANIKITDIEGNLVYETTSEGGTVLWNQKAFGKHKVASGVYMIFIASEDGTETKVKKVMIIR